jgi:chromosome segregation ATPase
MANQTKIDDILMEMISPKLKEIEGRFSKGEGLSNDDINTLLLKSQFNHINHLDEKLDEVTADVASLKTDMRSLEAKFGGLEAKFGGLEAKFGGLEAKFGGLEAKFGEMKAEIKLEIQTAINKNMQWSIGIITFIVTALKVIDMVWVKK